MMKLYIATLIFSTMASLGNAQQQDWRSIDEQAEKNRANIAREIDRIAPQQGSVSEGAKRQLDSNAAV